MRSEFKPSASRRPPSEPGLLARFREELEAVRVPVSLHGHAVGGPNAFRVVVALFNTLTPKHKRDAMRREARERERKEWDAARRDGPHG